MRLSFLVPLTVSLLLLMVNFRTINCSAVLIADFSMSKMIELSAKAPFCKIHHDRGDIQRMLLSADPRRIRQVPRDSVVALEGVCQKGGRDNHGDSRVGGGGVGRGVRPQGEQHQGGLGFIYPGTKWCGPGNTANDFNDLGRHNEEDRCCREHDLCPNTLAPGECRRGLCNSGSFTRSHCDCDARFRKCLQGLSTETANTLGAVFFNVVQVTCFRERSPCSVWQRSAASTASELVENDNVYHYKRSTRSPHQYSNPNFPCPLEFAYSDIYLPRNGRFLSNLISHRAKGLIDKNLIARSFHLSPDRETVDDFGEARSRLSVKVASLGLIAKNFVSETAKGFGFFNIFGGQK